jgi:hypothetical protein
MMEPMDLPDPTGPTTTRTKLVLSIIIRSIVGGGW